MDTTNPGSDMDKVNGQSFELTGEVRLPRYGEWFQHKDGTFGRANFNFENDERPIARPLPSPTDEASKPSLPTPESIIATANAAMETRAHDLARHYRARMELAEVELARLKSPSPRASREGEVRSVTNFCLTGEVRLPRKGEWYQDGGGFHCATIDFEHGRHPIARPAPSPTDEPDFEVMAHALICQNTFGWPESDGMSELTPDQEAHVTILEKALREVWDQSAALSTPSATPAEGDESLTPEQAAKVAAASAEYQAAFDAMPKDEQRRRLGNLLVEVMKPDDPTPNPSETPNSSPTRSATKFVGIDAKVLAPLMGDDGLVYFPAGEDQDRAEALRVKLDEFSRHVIRTEGAHLNGPDLQRYSKLAFLHIVGHELQTMREAWMYEANKRNTNRQSQVDSSHGGEGGVVEALHNEVKMWRAKYGPLPCGSNPCPICKAWVKTDVALASADKGGGRKAPEGCVIDDDGTVRLKLGDLWLTNDGAILGKGEAFAVYKSAYAEDSDPWRVGKCSLGSDPDNPEPWLQIDGCDEERCEVLSTWSTKEAAESAAGARGGERA